MAYECALGTNSTVAFGAAGSTAAVDFTNFGVLTSASFSMETNLPETTNNDDGGFTSNCSGNRSATLSVTVRFDYDGVDGQTDVLAAIEGSNRLAFLIRPVVATGEIEYYFDGRFSSYSVNLDNDETIDLSFEVSSTGPVTSRVQA